MLWRYACEKPIFSPLTPTHKLPIIKKIESCYDHQHRTKTRRQHCQCDSPPFFEVLRLRLGAEEYGINILLMQVIRSHRLCWASCN